MPAQPVPLQAHRYPRGCVSNPVGPIITVLNDAQAQSSTSCMTHRTREIKDWLSRHPEIENYVVIDDMMLDIPNLVKVSMENGILYEHQLQIFKLLRAAY